MLRVREKAGIYFLLHEETNLMNSEISESQKVSEFHIIVYDMIYRGSYMSGHFI